MAYRLGLRFIQRRSFFTGMARRNIAEEYLAEEKHAEGIYSLKLDCISEKYCLVAYDFPCQLPHLVFTVLIQN